MRYALLFPGQGSQHADMLPWLDLEPGAQDVLQALARLLGADWRQRLHQAPWREANAVAQVLLTGVSLAAWAALEPLLPGPPVAVAGYSVGELAAFSCAGAFGSGPALDLAVLRAGLMDRAAAEHTTGLLSVSGLAEERLAAGCAALKLECAIRIAPDHQVLAGEAEALDEAQRRLGPQGAVCKRLPIQLASHSSWMHEAAAAFARHLEPLPLGPIRCPVALNATGAATRRVDLLRAALSRQIETTVQWASCMDSVAEYGPACVLELGPGQALSRLWSARHPGIPVRAAEDFRDAGAIAAWVRRQGRPDAA